MRVFSVCCAGFKGMVDDVYLLPRAMTAGEVSARFARLPNLAPFQPLGTSGTVLR